MSALIAFALVQAAAQPCTSLCDADRLRPFLVTLARARTAKRPVRIVQIGDSHTAGDQITGSWRTLLQTRYGSGGRGALPPGRPYAGYLTRGITASQSDGWSVNGIFGAAYAGPLAPPIGLSGYSLTTARPGASIALIADAGQTFDRFTVCALRRPGAGAVMLNAGAVSAPWSLDGPRDEPDCRTIETPVPVANAAVIASGGPVTITSWATERRGQGGVVLSNLGTVGAQFLHFGRTDDAIVARELKDYRPDLIVVAFGTNEAFRPAFSATAYDAALRVQIARLRRLAGDEVPVLMLGAPDSATRLPSLQTGESGAGPDCGADADPWRPTAALATVQAIQRARAHDAGFAYWDWSARMGGRCTAHRWALAAPPLMRGDHVHFTSAGGAGIAQLLQADIDAALPGTPSAAPSAAWSGTVSPDGR